MPNKFQCKRCGACCKPGWTVNLDGGMPYTWREKLKSLITRKPLPSRVIYTTYTRWFEEDIERAASFLGISFDEFVEKYKLADDTAVLAAMHHKTKDELLKEHDEDRNITVDELKKSCPNYRSYQLYTAVSSKQLRDCPFVTSDDAGVHHCSIYQVRPEMCREFPSDKQLEKDFEFYQPHCPGFEKESDNG